MDTNQQTPTSTKMEAKKIGLDDASNEDNNSTMDSLPCDRKPNTRACLDSQYDHSKRSSVEDISRKEEDCEANSYGSPAARMLLAEERLLQIQQVPCSHTMFSSPGAYPIQGPRLTESPRCPCNDPASARVEPSDIWALDAELVREETVRTGGSTVTSSESSRFPTLNATILPRVKNGKKTRHMLCLVTFFVLLAAALVLFFVFTAKGSNAKSLTDASSSSSANSSQKQRPPSPSMDAKVYPPFQDTLPNFLLDEIQDPTSPFYSANLWMLGDPELQSYSSKRQKQRFYLAMLYHATNGDHWFHRDHWMSYNISECLWYSHSSLPQGSPYFIPNVCNENGTLTSLNLAQNNLTGSLPLFPTLLIPKLRALDLDGNYIGGAMPPFYSGPNLEVIIVSNNDFSESLTTGDGLFDFKLRVISVSGNRLTSGYPNNVGYFMSLLQNTLEIGNTTDNCLGGTIPTEAGLVSKAIYYGSGYNDMVGTVPSELGLLTHLQHMDVGGNYGLDGTLPAELGRLTALTHLNIAGTAISGSIPFDLCARVKEGTLEIRANCSLLDCCV